MSYVPAKFEVAASNILGGDEFTRKYTQKKETSDFHGTVSFDPIKMLKQK